MRKPVVGVIANAYSVENRFAVQMCGERNLKAVADVIGALPLMFAGSTDITDTDALLAAVDGIVLTGARANVHPTRFGAEAHARYEPYDIGRDALALDLAETCVARGVPLFGICRGFQEMNVAFGGTLHPEIRELPGRVNHRMPRDEKGEIIPDPAVIFADRHEVRLTSGGVFTRILGKDTIKVNSLHGQGILDLGKRVVVEGVAEDGTIEAIRIADAPGFALGVQWHAEYDPQRNPINRALFQAFGAAVKDFGAAMSAEKAAVSADDGMDTPRFIRAHLAPLAGKRVLDAGCGRGALARVLAAEGAEVTGIDPGEDAIIAARKAAPGARFEVAAAQALPFADASFDAVIFVNALHHVPDAAMRPALLEAHRVGAQDARLIVVEPLAQGGFHDVLTLIDDETEIRARAQAALHEIAGHEGFSLIETLTFTRREPFRDVDAFISRVTAVDPHREAAAQAKRAAIAEVFARHAVRDASGRCWLDQPLKADAFALR